MKSNLSWWFPHRPLAAVLIATLLTGWPVAAAAQAQRSLAEIARQEQERRKAIKVPSKVYTDRDLKKAPPPSTDAPAAAPVPVPAVPASQELAAEAARDAAVEQAEWKKRMDDAREEVRRNDMFVEALQSRVNALTNDFVNRSDPYQRAKIAEDRQKALAELDRVKADLERAKKQITTIEEDARTAGVPPGWIR